MSTGGVTPTGGRVASRTMVEGSSRRAASQEGATRGVIKIDYCVRGCAMQGEEGAAM